MGGQSIERREILRYLGIAAVAASFPGFSRWAFACPQNHPQPAAWGADGEPNRPGTSLHETGVSRFGNDPKKYVTNKWAQTHDVPNFYICDASIFPSCTDKTTTMPIIAFTMRTCDYMLDNFKRGVHKRA